MPGGVKAAATYVKHRSRNGKKQKADPTLNSTKMVVFSTVVIVQKRPYNASVQPKDMMKVSDNKFQAARSRAVMLSTFLSYNLSEPSKIIAN